MKRHLLVASLLFGSVCLGLAQQPGEKPPEREVPLPGKGVYTDPTQPSPKMRDALGVSKPGPRGPVATAKTPGISLRGRVLRKGQPPAALIDVDGRIYTITVGSSIIGSGNTIMKVIELNSTEVRLEVLPLKETIVLR